MYALPRNGIYFRDLEKNESLLPEEKNCEKKWHFVKNALRKKRQTWNV